MKIDLQKALSRIKNLCQKQGVSYLVTRNLSNIRYLTGCIMHATGDGFALITPSKIVIFSDARYEGTLKRIAAGNPLIEVFIWDRLTMCDDIAKFVRKGSTLGFEKMNPYTCYSFVQGLKKATRKRGIKIKGVEDIIEYVRITKVKSEIALFKKAFAFSDQAFEQIVRMIKPGITELEISQELGRILRMLSECEDLSFATIVASGPNSGIPHAIPGRRKLKNGDAVTLDFGCIVDGYHSDMTRTVFVGEPCEKLRRIYEIVLEAQTAAEKQACAGMTGQDIDKIARDIITQAGYKKYFVHGTGHGVGLDIHERPYITYVKLGSNELKPGMVHSVEPGIYLPDEYGVRIENVVLITETGAIPLNLAPKELLIL